jgi:hypothetical protein
VHNGVAYNAVDARSLLAIQTLFDELSSPD